MSRTAVAEQPTTLKRKASGADIRARIEANARKRRSIAEQMKREAGVRGHVENRKEMSGLAWTDTGFIETPESRNIANLYVLAHECGHVFLHMHGIGRVLPPHVMEYEAECYAHQALRHYGMNVPLMHTARARRYVAAMIDQDRARRLPISPVAERFALGPGLPYAPLRARPKSWPDTRPLARLEDLYPDYVVKVLRDIEAKQSEAAHQVRRRHLDKCYLYPTIGVSLITGMIIGHEGGVFAQPAVAGALALYLVGRASIDWVDRVIARRKALATFLRDRDRPTTLHIELHIGRDGRPFIKQVRAAA